MRWERTLLSNATKLKKRGQIIFEASGSDTRAVFKTSITLSRPAFVPHLCPTINIATKRGCGCLIALLSPMFDSL